MIHKIHLWGALGSLILCSSIFACPSGNNIQTILNNGNTKDFFQLVSEFEQCDKWQDSLGLVYHKLSVHHYGLNIDSAIIYAEKALEVQKVFYQEEPAIHLGKSYNNLGVFYRKEGEYILAKFHLQHAIAIFKKLGERKRLRNSQYELSWIYRVEGDFLKSETLLNFLIKSSLPKENEAIADYLITLGNNYRDQRKYQEAKDALENAIKILQTDTIISQVKAKAHQDLGSVYYYLGQYQKAFSNFKQAIEVFRDYENCTDLAISLNHQGLTFLKTKEAEKALASIEEGLAAAQLCNQAQLIAQCHDNIGEVFTFSEENKKASTAFSLAIQTLLPTIKTKNKLDNELKNELIRSSFKTDLLVYLSDKTRALKALYIENQNSQHLKEALYFLDVGDFLIDELRQNHNDQSTKLFWRQEVLSFYEKAIELCALLNDTDKAFYYFEKSKSILLLEALLSSNALQSIPDSLQRKVKYLKRQIRLKRESIEQVSNQNKAEIFKEILSLEETLNQLNQTLAEQYPQLKAINKQKQVVDVNQFRQVYLQEQNRQLVHYFYGKEHVYALVLSKDEKQVFRLGTSDEINILVRDLLQYFEQADRIESAPKDYLQQAQRVYQVLIKPLALPAQSELLIIPAGILTYLPFEALVTAYDDSYGIATAPYFVLEHQLWYGFSATLFDQIEQRTLGQSPKSLLALAPFANTSTSQYPALSFSQDELSTIRSYVQTDLYVDQEANLDVFLKNQPDYSVLHLSTHAFSSFSATQPFIVFSDTILDLAELYQQHIPANLVVLSACQTQIGKLAPGEGVLGLNRGFFYAGARSVVSSLWNMNAQSTSNLLSSFYKSMYEGMPKYLALQEAKKTYLLNENIPSYQKSPYYWAGMSYYGDSEGWAVQPSRNWPYYLGALLAIVFGFGFWKIKKK